MSSTRSTNGGDVLLRHHAPDGDAVQRRHGAAGATALLGGAAHGAHGPEGVDEAGRDVPADNASAGEIWLAADTVAAGYLDMPEETTGSRSGRWFRTGDVAVVDAERYVTIVDRTRTSSSPAASTCSVMRWRTCSFVIRTWR